MLILSVFITCMIVSAMISDVTRFIIPNVLVLVILLSYPILVFISPVMPDWKTALLVALASFFVGYVLFSFNLMGGGDVKLFAVIALFVGKNAFPEFLMGVALLGGLLSVVLIVARKSIAYGFARLGKSVDSLPRILKVGEPAPYGVAIGTAFLILFWKGEIIGVTP